jgi:hypothetical protein
MGGGDGIGIGVEENVDFILDDSEVEMDLDMD